MTSLTNGIGVFASVVDDFALRAPGQVEIAHKDVAGVEASGIVLTLGPSRVVGVAPTVARITGRLFEPGPRPRSGA
jgi:hypothetical protein